MFRARKLVSPILFGERDAHSLTLEVIATMLFPSVPVAAVLQALYLAAFPIPGNSDHLRAPRDPATAYMDARPATITPNADAAQADYFKKEIPRVIHQIWFGDPAKMNRETVEAWQSFAAAFGYTYRLWTEADEADFAHLLGPRDLALFHQQFETANYYGASDILRLSLLAEFGGVYADLDIKPPTYQGELVDLATLLPMSNVVLITERDSRSVVDSSMFVGNNFMMAAPHHPLIEHLKAGLYQNTATLNGAANGELPTQYTTPTMYSTGPFYISLSLAGVFTMMPYNYARQYGMLTYDAKRY